MYVYVYAMCSCLYQCPTYSKVESDFGICPADIGEETRLFVGAEFVGQGCAVDPGDGHSQQAEEEH